MYCGMTKRKFSARMSEHRDYAIFKARFQKNYARGRQNYKVLFFGGVKLLRIFVGIWRDVQFASTTARDGSELEVVL